jgi:hypothetical protein
VPSGELCHCLAEEADAGGMLVGDAGFIPYCFDFERWCAADGATP